MMKNFILATKKTYYAIMMLAKYVSFYSLIK